MCERLCDSASSSHHIYSHYANYFSAAVRCQQYRIFSYCRWLDKMTVCSFFWTVLLLFVAVVIVMQRVDSWRYIHYGNSNGLRRADHVIRMLFSVGFIQSPCMCLYMCSLSARDSFIYRVVIRSICVSNNICCYIGFI